MNTQSLNYDETIAGGTNALPVNIALSNQNNKASIMPVRERLNRDSPLAHSNYAQRFLRQKEYCNLAVIFVAEHFKVPIRQLMCKTRANAQAARARQIAIYVAHTTFSVAYREAAAYFQRDRTTIAHACRTIEDQRDDRSFDAKLTMVENLVEEAAEFTSGQVFHSAENSTIPKASGEYGI